MKNIPYTLSFGIALVCVMFSTACDNNVDMPGIFTPVKNGYGKISIAFIQEESPARTTLPSMVFDKYAYTFTKEGETAGVEKTPDRDGYFLLEIGNYTVAVQAYTAAGDSYTLAASGVSEQFSVGPGINASVKVLLSGIDTGVGTFTYTITYPANVTALVTLQKWLESDIIPLDPITISSGNGITETLQLDAGSYLLTVIVMKPNSYAGTSEVVRIFSSLSTVYTKDFVNTDFIAGIPVTVNDYIISGAGEFTYDGAEKTVTITRKANASPGAITILYNGEETPPVNAGTYSVTFTVEEVGEYVMMAGALPAGTITINKANSSVSSWPTAQAITYGGTLSSSALSGGAGEPAGTFAWTNGAVIPNVINSGYDVTFTPNDAVNYNTLTKPIAITVYKAPGAAAAAPTGTAYGSTNSITIIAVTVPSGQTVEYAISTTDSVPATGWQTSTFFSNLTQGVTYYLFARSKENDNYYTGEASASLKESPGYTVTFNINGGTGTTPINRTVSPITGTTLPDSSGFSKGNYTFGGWNTSSTGNGTNYNAGSTYYPTGTITLYARWTYKVTFDINGGTGTVPAQQLVTGSFKLPDSSGFAKTGYTFGGWNLRADGKGANYNADSSFTVTYDITFYARWSSAVTFDINGGSGTAPDPQTVAPGSGITLPDGSGLSNNGYTFNGWNTRADGTGTNYAAGVSYTPAGNITLYANWKVIVSFTINGGTGTTPDPQTVAIGTGITLPDGSGLSRTGYTFTGWNTNADGTGTNYAAGSSYTPTENITLYAQWTSVVTFDINGGTGTTPAAQTAVIGSGITLPDESGLSRTGYTFSGWNTKADGTGTNYNAGSSYTPAGNITLYAQWTSVVTFDINSGTGTTPAAQSVVAGSRITLPNGTGLTKSGYLFKGWNTSADGTGTNYNAGSSYTPTGSITLYARWMYPTVTFNTNSGSGTPPAAQSAAAGSAITLPDGSGLSRTGYTFSGWNTNTSGTGTTYDADSLYTLTGDITLYAKWMYVVTFDINSGSGTTPAAQSVVPGSGITLPDGSGLTKSGYLFAGWTTNASGTGTNYAAGSTYTPTVNITLYANWKAPVVVTYNINGGSGTTPAQQTVASGISFTLPGGSGLTKSGYLFKGWNTSAEGTGTTYTSTYTPTGNITLYARWTYPTVTYSINGGSGTTPSSQSAAANTSITLASGSGLSRTDYTFSGWNTNTSGTGTNYAAGSSYTLTGDITLYAQWTRVTYTVTFNINGATSGTAPASMTVDSGGSITLPGNGGFSRTNYTFGGWNTGSAGNGTNYSAGSAYTPTGSITLYARWTAISVTEYTITYDINGGSGTTPAAQKVTAGNSVTLNNGSGFSRTGYLFASWYNNPSGTGTVYTAGSTYPFNTFSGNITLYARWVEAWTVTFMRGNSDDAGSPPPAMAVQKGGSISIPGRGTLTNGSRTFSGWSLSSSALTADYTSGNSYTPTANVNMYPVWK